MPALYTIESVDPETRTWDSRFGQMLSYKVTFATGETVEVSQKPTTPAPQAGQTLFGTVTEGQYGLKFKKEQQQPGASKQGGFTPVAQSLPTFEKGSEPKGGDAPDQAYWEERNRRIQRQHSQEMALRYLALTGKKLTSPEQVVDAIDFFEKDLDPKEDEPKTKAKSNDDEPPIEAYEE